MAAGFLIIVAIPLVMNVWFSLHNWQGGASEMTWVGLGNYVELMQDPTFWQSFRNTLYMIVAIVVVPTLVGLLLASVLFNLVAPRVGERTAAFLRGSYYLPQILPIAVAGFMWSWILDTDGGALNAVLTAIGVASPPDWLGSADVAIYGIMLMLICCSWDTPSSSSWRPSAGSTRRSTRPPMSTARRGGPSSPASPCRS